MELWIEVTAAKEMIVNNVTFCNGTYRIVNPVSGCESSFQLYHAVCKDVYIEQAVGF